MRQILVMKLFLMTALLLVVTTKNAWAQNLGSISGHVLDQLGSPIRGVMVSITSPTQIGGTKNTYSNDEGVFHFTGLFPGTFKVTASAPKLRTVTQAGVLVSPRSTTEIDLVMDVETGVEDVKVIEKAPTVNVHKSSISEDIDVDFADKLPLPSRDYQGIASLAAGVIDDGSGNPQVRGGTSFNNSYTVDGFNTTDPVTHTFGQNFSFGAIAAVQVDTASKGAENSGTLGGVINTVTKSGSNKLEVDTYLTYQDQNMQLFKDTRDAKLKTRQGNIAVQLSGPIVKDRLWFLATVDGDVANLSLPQEHGFPDHPPLSQHAYSAFGKVNWQLSPRNKIEFRAHASQLKRDNSTQAYQVEAEAESQLKQRTEGLSLQWLYLPTDAFFLVTQVSYQQQELQLKPQSCTEAGVDCLRTAASIDSVTGFQRFNFDEYQVDQRRSWSLGERIEWIKDSRHLGSHYVTLGAKAGFDDNQVVQTTPGDAVFFTAKGEPLARQDVCSNDPKLSEGMCRRNLLNSNVQGQRGMAWLEDRFRPTRFLTITPGIAAHLGSSQDDRENQVTDIFAITPHLAATWDATHDSKTSVRGSFDGAADTGFLALDRFQGRALFSRTCLWDPATQTYSRNCRSEGGNEGRTVGLPCGPDGVAPDGKKCTSKLRPARTWEYSLGVEREISDGISLNLRGIYRKFVHQWEDAETNAFWNQGGTALDRSTGYRSRRSEVVYDLQTPDSARREYRAAELQLRKREGRMRATATYTLAKYEGTDDSSYGTQYLDNPGQNVYEYGPLRNDIRHDLRALAVYQFANWLSVGGVYNFQSGRPYNRYFWDSTYQNFTRREAQRGYDSRGTQDPGDDSPLRTPDISLVSAQVRFYLKPIVKQNIEAWIDAHNILALRTNRSVIERDGPTWGRPVNRMPPLNFLIGARYKY